MTPERLGLPGHLRYSEAERAWMDAQTPFQPIDAAARLKAGTGASVALDDAAQWSYRAESSTRPAKAAMKPKAPSAAATTAKIERLELEGAKLKAENAELQRRLAVETLRHLREVSP